MLNLLRADWYRITRPRGLRGSLWQYGIALIAVYALIIGVMMFAKTQAYANLSGGNAVEIPSDFDSYTAYLGSMQVGFVQLCVSFLVVEHALQEFKNGFVKSVLSARRGRLSYFLEKLLFAGATSAAVTLGSVAFITLGGMICGFSYAQADSPLVVAGWLAAFWFNTWAMAAISLVIVYATRVSPLSYFGAFVIYAGVVPAGLKALAQLSGGMLSVLQPLRPAFETLAAWMPSSALSLLGRGGTLFSQSAAEVWGSSSQALVIAPGAQVVLTGIIWMAAAAVVVLAIARRRDI